MDRWITIKDGQVFLNEENDGWTFLRRGPERSTTPIVIERIEPDPPSWTVYYCAASYSGHMIVSEDMAVCLLRFVSSERAGK